MREVELESVAAIAEQVTKLSNSRIDVLRCAGLNVVMAVCLPIKRAEAVVERVGLFAEGVHDAVKERGVAEREDELTDGGVGD